MKDKSTIIVLFGMVIPFVLGALSGAYGKKLIRKIETEELLSRISVRKE